MKPLKPLTPEPEFREGQVEPNTVFPCPGCSLIATSAEGLAAHVAQRHWPTPNKASEDLGAELSYLLNDAAPDPTPNIASEVEGWRHYASLEDAAVSFITRARREGARDTLQKLIEAHATGHTDMVTLVVREHERLNKEQGK